MESDNRLLLLFARDLWNSGIINFSMEIFANSRNLISLLRRDNVNLIQYNVETTRAIQINSNITGTSSLKSTICHVAHLHG